VWAGCTNEKSILINNYYLFLIDMVLIFLGAGFSKAVAGIPDMKDLNKGFEEFLKEKNEYKLEQGYRTIKKQIEKVYKEFKLNKTDVEAILTVLENLKSGDTLCNIRDPTALYILGGSCHNLIKAAKSLTTKKNFLKIARYLKFYILTRCLEAKKKDSDQLFRLMGIHAWLKDEHIIYNYLHLGYKDPKKSDKYVYHGLKHPKNDLEHPLYFWPGSTPNIEIFTTNYDLILEDFFREYNFEFTNGQTKDKVDLSRNNKELGYEQQNIKIFKLHGSANWFTIKEKQNIFFHELPVPIDITRIGEKDKDMVIYPVAEKVWMRLPFSYLYLRFRSSLIKSDKWVFIGFSLRDKEIAEIMINASEMRYRKGESLDLYIIDPHADKIKKRLDSLRGTIHPINKGIEEVKIEDFGKCYIYSGRQ